MTKSLTDLFNQEKQGEYVPSSMLEAAKLEQVDKDYAMREGGADSIGRTALSYSKKDENHSENSKKKERVLSDLLTRLMDQQRWLEQQIETIKLDIVRLNKEIDVHAYNLNALDEFLENYRNDGEFELAEDGYPVDEQIRQLIIKREQETGITWNASTSNAIGFIRDIEEIEREEITELSYQRDEKYKQWDTYQKAYENTTESINKLERGEYVNDVELLEIVDEESSLTENNNILNDLDTLPSLGM